MLIEMSQKDIKSLKEKLWIMNDKKCPLLGVNVELDKMVLDHIHKLKSEECSVDKGTIRNALEFRANAMEGKIFNNWKRYFGSDVRRHPISLSNFLRNLAEYLERGAYQDEDGNFYIHPKEVKREPLIGKREFNDLNKKYKLKYPKRKPLRYPKSKKWTKQLKQLKEELNED